MLFFLMTTGSTQKGARDANTRFESLLADMAGGDTQALEALYTQTKTAVYGFALSILKNPQNAEDVMQDCYVRMYQAAAAYRPQGKPMAWILTIVRNLALMKLREGKRDGGPIEEQSLPAARVDFTESSVDRMVLHAALATLSDEERQIVTLHSVSGLKHREIAEILELPLSTVLSKHRRALAKLKKQIKEEAQ